MQYVLATFILTCFRYFEYYLEKCEKSLIIYQNYIEEMYKRLIDYPLIGVSITAEGIKV